MRLSTVLVKVFNPFEKVYKYVPSIINSLCVGKNFIVYCKVFVEICNR